MPLEYEYKFLEYDKKSLLKQVKEMGGKKIGLYLFKVMVFVHPHNKANTYIRIRDEGFKTTMTYKFMGSAGFADESEIIIDNFDVGKEILLGLGCTKKYYYEKMREIWQVGSSEIVFDIIPAHPEYMEIESDTKEHLDEIVNKLNLTDNTQMGKLEALINEKFGITLPLPKNTEITFNNLDDISKIVTKNKTEFDKLMAHQKKLYSKIKKH